MKNSVKRFALGTVVAAAAGYVAGILTAPQSGKETRKDIKDTAVQSIHEAERQLKRLHTELNDVIAEGLEKADRLSGKAKQELEGALQVTHSAKGKARDILSAVHEGRAEDKELQKAIKEAKDAIDHLKAYLKKH
jgi:gas vesicle protein